MKLSPCSDPALDRMDLGKPQKSKESRPVRSAIRPQMFQIKRTAFCRDQSASRDRTFNQVAENFFSFFV
jgi:hypothetical protein